MSSIKVKFRPSSVPGKEGTIYYRILHARKPRQLHTDYHLFPHEWDEQASSPIISSKADRLFHLHAIKSRIRRDIERLTKIIRDYELHNYTFTADDIIEEFHRHKTDYTLVNFMENRICKLSQNGKLRTAETYRAALNSFRRFLQEWSREQPAENMEDIMLDCITAEVMEAYEGWQRKRGIALNTISFYTRILRAVYNRAAEDGIIENLNPFRHVYTGVDKTVKRALPISVIKKLKHLDLSAFPTLDYARDIFMLSFYLRGMSFIDMSFMRKTDLTNGYVTYRRRKTGQSLTIAWTKDMQKILDKYPENDSDYLLPIIRHRDVNERVVYRNKAYNINRHLKSIASKLGINTRLTLYVARHSWASAAKAKGIPLPVISEGMGHDSETTTRIYLASLDTSIVDQANSLILDSL